MDRKDYIIKLSQNMAKELDNIKFDFDGYVYNPLDYAFDNYKAYIDEAILPGQEVFFLGLNAGSWGMGETGVPFGDKDMVKSYLNIDGKVGHPKNESPEHIVEGLNSKRGELSGKRFWTMASLYGPKEEFFRVATVFNYSPLCFLDKNGNNLDAAKIPHDDRLKMQEICDSFLENVLTVLDVQKYIAIGEYAEAALKRQKGVTKVFPHPSGLDRKHEGFWPDKALLEFKSVIDE